MKILKMLLSTALGDSIICCLLGILTEYAHQSRLSLSPRVVKVRCCETLPR